MDREKIMQELSDIGQEFELHAEVINLIAVHLDYPSVFMGGPSSSSKRRAGKILAGLEECGFTVVRRK